MKNARTSGQRKVWSGSKTESEGLAIYVNNFLSLYALNGLYCPCASREKLKENKNTQDTVEPRYNEGPRDWQNCSLRGFVISRFLFIYFTITGVKKIVRYNDDFVT